MEFIILLFVLGVCVCIFGLIEEHRNWTDMDSTSTNKFKEK